ncbi:nicotinate-nucleotide-dimethylbenzimidazole phosphoribosyltransferase [Cutibacterium acnes JCM 18918]|nr:nicotinate-nucleotide-dimethylbenzimidazole phosphoribosyltransferase [Cutibacterium acnes JCM 18918]
MLIDGVIACSAALTATAICPEARDFIITSHAGAEPGITRRPLPWACPLCWTLV